MIKGMNEMKSSTQSYSKAVKTEEMATDIPTGAIK